MKATIPLNEVLSGGTLKDFYDDLIKVRSDREISNDGVNVVIESPSLKLTITEQVQILQAGGDVEQLLMSVRADIGLLNTDIPEGIPNQNTIDELALPEVRKFKNWFDTSAELYINDIETKVYFLTNPLGNSATDYLKASELLILAGLTASSLEVRTSDQFNEDILTGWNKINF